MNDFLVKTSGLDVNAETLVVLHGWGMNSQVWDAIREDLESQYRVLWVDLPGHGFNRDVSADSLEQIVDLVLFADVIKTSEKIHLLGWSLGGFIAQAIALQAPDKISSMTLVSSSPKFSQSVDWPHAMSEEALLTFANNLKQDVVMTLKGFVALEFLGVKHAKEAQRDLLSKILNPPSDASKLSKKGGGGLLDNEMDSSGKIEGDYLPNQAALELGLQILNTIDLRDHPASCPQHWMFAGRDRLIPKEVINDLKSLRPNAQITLLESAGHAPFMTHPELFLEHFHGFMKNALS